MGGLTAVDMMSRPPPVDDPGGLSPAAGGWGWSVPWRSQAAVESEGISLLLDTEVRSLFERINEKTVTAFADQAVQGGKIRQVQHFVVSAVGESPQHRDKLAERGISPFRVLDPILWGMATKGIEI